MGDSDAVMAHIFPELVDVSGVVGAVGLVARAD
jgi:hypothetical protein